MSEDATTPSIIDPVAAGDAILKAAHIPQSQEAQVLNQLREWLKRGATISATDPSGSVLEDQGDGIWNSGLTIKFPEGVPQSVLDKANQG